MEGKFDGMYTNHPANENYEWAKKKYGKKEAYKKMAGPSVQGIVKTQLKVVEVENASLCPHGCSLNYTLTG